MKHSENIDQEKGMEEPFINHPSKSLGGVKTLPFILVNEACEKASYFGLQPNMILYLMGAYGLDLTTAANIMFFWFGATNFTPIVGAFLADAYVGRYRMIAFGSVLTLIGTVLLWLTTVIPGLMPSKEQTTINSLTSSPPLLKLIYLCASFFLMAIGAGGIRSSSLAFGADQLSSTGDVENAKMSSNNKELQSLFSWYYFSTAMAIVFGLTGIVYIQDHLGWQIGFAVPTLLVVAAALLFISGSPFYVRVMPVASVLTRLAQVVVAAWRNRHYKLLSDGLSDGISYYVAKGSAVDVPSEKLRFLNKACIIKESRRDLTLDGMAVDPWSLCTTDQVEDLKSIINIIPIWSSVIMAGVTSTTSSSFVVVQAKSMDRHFISQNFEIPAASFPTFSLISILVWLILFNQVILPLASKVRGRSVTVDAITQTGLGLVMSIVSVTVAGFVESVRRGTALETMEGNDTFQPMSALWLVPQAWLTGLGEGITAVAQLQFLYSEFPKSMSSISSNLWGLSLSVSSFVASFIISLVNYVTKQGGKESWVSNDLNKGHYDYYYWVLACLSLVNYFYFLACSKAYRKKNKVSHEIVH
ncbi:hypothetical protein RND81_03G150500 [Saponaria officinalis]|uniref:Protein NRT1/ PTR FAMILY 1.2-like n=1 Tax=Saponaria officinalis TaxID=3572 RepID=A0AAW1M5Z5_SAPOF